MIPVSALRHITLISLTVLIYVLTVETKGETAIASAATPTASSAASSAASIDERSIELKQTDAIPILSPTLSPTTQPPIASSRPPALEQASDLGQSISATDPAPLTAVSQLADVAPTDWAYQALQSLVERYGCLAGYPDRTYWGSRSLSRFEFAAGVKACLAALSQHTTNTENAAQQEDLTVIQRLQTEFAAELLALGDRVDELEAQVTDLETNEFSPTATLNALSSFNLSYAFADGDILAEGIPLDIKPAARLPLRVPNPETGELEPLVGVVDENPPVTVSQSTYLLFRFSATGRDELSALLAMGNGDPPASVFSSAGFTSSSGVPYADSNPVTPLEPNDVGLFELKYSFPVTNNLQLVIGPRILPYRHFDLNSYTNVVQGASGINFYQSTLANTGLSGMGAIVEWNISRQWLVRTGYLARNDAPLRYADGDGPFSPARGLFDSTNSILAEVTYSPSRDLNIRLHYNRTRLDAPPASPVGAPSQPFLLTSLRGVVDDGVGGSLNDVIAHNFVLNFDWLITSGFALFGRYSYSISEIDPINPEIENGQVDLQAFQFGMAFPDLGKEGALGTVTAVVPFDVVSGRRFLLAGNGDGGTEVDVLATYYYPIGDHVAIVPMFFATFNPNNFSENSPVYSTILRTQFLF